MTTATRPIPQSVRNLQNQFDPENILLPVSPSLAQVLGINKAHIIFQLHYWLQNPKAGYLAQGVKWIYNGYKEWANQLTWLTAHQIGKHFRKLEDEGILISDNFHPNPYDRRKWYRINYQVLEQKTGWRFPDLPPSASKQSKKSKKSNSSSEDPKPLVSSNLPNDTMDSASLNNALCDCDTIINKEYPQNTKDLFFEDSEEENLVNEENCFSPEEEESQADEVTPGDNVEEVSFGNEDSSSTNSNLGEDKYSENFSTEENEGEIGGENAISEEKNEGVMADSEGGSPAGGRGFGSGSKRSVAAPKREQYEWEVAVGRPYPDFVRWRANVHYQPQGGHWEASAGSHAMAEITRKSESKPEVVRWMWREFLEYANRSADNAFQAEAMGSEPSLPSCFEEKEVDQQVVERKLVRAKESVSEGQQQALEAKRDSALPEGEVTPEEAFYQELEKKLMCLRSAWKRSQEYPGNPMSVRWSKEIPERVEAIPGLMMTPEGPAIDPDFVFVPE